MAKAAASEAALRAARAALQCHGAIGYSFEYDLHMWMKRAWALAGAWGDAAWHRARVAAAVLDDPTRDPARDTTQGPASRP
jgi:alkylation response protein AidB-like acyl-CoA dehydrogenase